MAEAFYEVLKRIRETDPIGKGEPSDKDIARLVQVARAEYERKSRRPGQPMPGWMYEFLRLYEYITRLHLEAGGRIVELERALQEPPYD